MTSSAASIEMKVWKFSIFLKLFFLDDFNGNICSDRIGWVIVKVIPEKLLPFLQTATSQFKTENDVFGTPGHKFSKIGLSDAVLVEISAKFGVWRVKFCIFLGSKIPVKESKISRKCESEEFLRII